MQKTGTNRILSIILTFALVLGVAAGISLGMPMTALGASGDADNPYVVTSLGQLNSVIASATNATATNATATNIRLANAIKESGDVLINNKDIVLDLNDKELAVSKVIVENKSEVVINKKAMKTVLDVDNSSVTINTDIDVTADVAIIAANKAQVTVEGNIGSKKVSINGNVKELKDGQVQGDYTLFSDAGTVVKVKEVYSPVPVAPTAITITPSGSATVLVGKSLQLTATLTPSNAAGDITWKSSNGGVATVSTTGSVKAQAVGTATITASVTYGGKTLEDTIKITVVSEEEAKDPESIKIVYDGPTTLQVGQTVQMGYKLTPEDAVYKSIVWQSTPDGAVSVDYQTGLVTAVKPGQSIINVTVYYDEYYSHTDFITVDVEAGTYTLTVRAGVGGSVRDDLSGEYAPGDVISISARANSRYAFRNWAATAGEIENVARSSTTFVMPAEDAEITAYFMYVGSSTSGGGTTGGTGGSGSGGGSSSSSRRSSSRSSSGGGGGSSSTTSTTRTTTTTTTSTSTAKAGRSSNVGEDGSVTTAAVVSDLKSSISSTTGNTATVRVRNAETISANTLKELAETAAAEGKTAVIHADTMNPNGKGVQGRLYVEPAKLTNLTGDLKLGVYTEESKTASIKNRFEKHFDNNVAVVKFEQTGTFGARLKIAAKVDLSELDTDNLVFYAYDQASNSYALIENPEYSIDSNGYVHFYTEQAGAIIITDKPLTK